MKKNSKYILKLMNTLKYIINPKLDEKQYKEYKLPFFNDMYRYTNLFYLFLITLILETILIYFRVCLSYKNYLVNSNYVFFLNEFSGLFILNLILYLLFIYLIPILQKNKFYEKKGKIYYLNLISLNSYSPIQRHLIIGLNILFEILKILIAFFAMFVLITFFYSISYIVFQFFIIFLEPKFVNFELFKGALWYILFSLFCFMISFEFVNKSYVDNYSLFLHLKNTLKKLKSGKEKNLFLEKTYFELLKKVSFNNISKKTEKFSNELIKRYVAYFENIYIPSLGVEKTIDKKLINFEKILIKKDFKELLNYQDVFIKDIVKNFNKELFFLKLRSNKLNINDDIFLNKLDKHFTFDYNKALKNIYLFFFTNPFGLFLSFLIIVLIMKYLGLERYYLDFIDIMTKLKSE